MTESIIIYRNPIEKQMYEEHSDVYSNGVIFFVFLILVAALLHYVCPFHIKQKMGDAGMPIIVIVSIIIATGLTYLAIHI